MTHIDGGATPFLNPESVTLAPLLTSQQRQLYVLDSGNNRIVRVPISYSAFPPYNLSPVTIYNSATGSAGPLNHPHDIDYSEFNDPVLGAFDVGCVPSAAIAATGPVAACPLGDSPSVHL